ncbi:MAG TPA: hypothetical protein ENJ07_04060 [Gammaproteobacteria bacterium]|nr:hypothetical protein [Gammaproteobacteria bacterium]
MRTDGESSAANVINGNEDDNSFDNADAAYLYRFDGQSWGQKKRAIFTDFALKVRYWISEITPNFLNPPIRTTDEYA